MQIRPIFVALKSRRDLKDYFCSERKSLTQPHSFCRNWRLTQWRQRVFCRRTQWRHRVVHTTVFNWGICVVEIFHRLLLQMRPYYYKWRNRLCKVFLIRLVPSCQGITFYTGTRISAINHLAPIDGQCSEGSGNTTHSRYIGINIRL